MIGFHDIESVFQKISLYDELYVIKEEGEKGITIETNIKSLEGEDNIIFKAYNLLKSKFSRISKVKVKLKKNIPMQAGLGGGSTDCGAFIECMNKLFDLGLNHVQMQELGEKLGADVPASFHDKPIIARGIGDEIYEIDASFKFYLVLIKPTFACDTKLMYEKLDNTSKNKQEYNSKIIKNAIENKNIELLAKKLYNVFELAEPNICDIKRDLKNSGAINSLMSGSGSCVYGVFRNKEQAKIAYRNLKKRYEVYFCITK